MSSRGRPLERTRSIEDLHELRLMALLHDLVREHQRKGAGEILGLDPRTVGACLERGALSMWVRTALEGLLLSREQAAMAAQQEIERVLQVGFELARGRRKKLTSVDKANVLETSRLWRQIAIELGPEYPDVHLEHMLVDTCAMQLIQRPSSFDVIVAENTFGDILTDEAAVLTASMGLLPSASLAFSPETTRQPSGGDAPPVATSGSKAKRPERGRKAALRMYEPIHGSAPDIAGQGVANPIATILSVALMMRYSLGLTQEAAAVEGAVKQMLQDGYRTPDIFSPEPTGRYSGGDADSKRDATFSVIKVGSVEMGDRVAEAL